VKDEQEKRRAILESLAGCDTSTLVRLHALLTGAGDNRSDSGKGYLDYLQAVAESDVAGLKSSEKSYGDSWKRRGGVDTFHMLARKWDRLERRLATNMDAARSMSGAAPYDIFEQIAADRRADGIIDDVRDLRRYLLLVEAEAAARESGRLADSGRKYLNHLQIVAKSDVRAIQEKEKSHGNSWKRRGGVGAFMMFARKWDRILERVAKRIEGTGDTPAAASENIFEHVAADRRAEGIIDDVRDLRRYLMLVEAEMAARGAVEIGSARDNREEADEC
jgi:hypothetical protein